MHVYIFVLTNALPGTFATADALSCSHNEASGRMLTLLLNFRASCFVPNAEIVKFLSTCHKHETVLKFGIICKGVHQFFRIICLCSVCIFKTHWQDHCQQLASHPE